MVSPGSGFRSPQVRDEETETPRIFVKRNVLEIKYQESQVLSLTRRVTTAKPLRLAEPNPEMRRLLTRTNRATGWGRDTVPVTATQGPGIIQRHAGLGRRSLSVLQPQT